MKGEVRMFGYVVWAMYVGHRVWIWGDLKEDGWQGQGGGSAIPACKRSRIQPMQE